MSEIKKHASVSWEGKSERNDKKEKVISLDAKRFEKGNSEREDVRTEIDIENEGQKPATVIYINSGFGKIAAGTPASSPICQAA